MKLEEIAELMKRGVEEPPDFELILQAARQDQALATTPFGYWNYKGRLLLHAILHKAGDLATQELVSQYVALYPEAVSTPDSGGYLPLHCAVNRCPMETIQYLIELHPSAIRTLTADNMYPLHFSGSRFEVIRVLVERFSRGHGPAIEDGLLAPSSML